MFLNAGCRKTFPVKTGLVWIPLISKYFTISNLENFAFPLIVKGNANHDVSTSGSCFGNSKNSISEKNLYKFSKFLRLIDANFSNFFNCIIQNAALISVGRKLYPTSSKINLES